MDATPATSAAKSASEALYERMDALIISCIQNGSGLPLSNRTCVIESEHLAAKVIGQGEAFRIIDRRLQYLRKKGVIAYVRGRGAHWVMAGGR